MTKQETLQFLEYLRTKENVVVDEYITRGMFIRHLDRTPFLLKVLTVIKKCENAEIAYQKAAITICENQVNCLHKLFPQIAYAEDLDEYLVCLNIADADRKKYVLSAVGGTYKTQIRKRKLEPLEGALHLYMKASRYLPSREFFSRRFKTEYENWRKKNGYVAKGIV